MNKDRLVDASTANYQFALASFMIKSQVECFNKCLVDFQTKDLSGMEQMCTSDCIKKSSIAVQEMQSAEYARQMWLSMLFNALFIS